MKTFLLVAGVLISIAATQLPLLQSAEGIITYEVKIKVHRNLPEGRQAMKNMIPEFRIHRDQLFFNASESLYKPVEVEPEEDTDNGQGVRMRTRRPKLEVYTNPNEFKCVMTQEFRGKRYLIEDSLRVSGWKMSDESREVKGYLCKQATFYDVERQQTIIAWYSDKFRPFLGPENFNNLPGAVLLVDINDGERVITASNIVFRSLARDELKIPTARAKLTEQEYRKMIREEMERRRWNGGDVIIRH